MNLATEFAFMFFEVFVAGIVHGNLTVSFKSTHAEIFNIDLSTFIFCAWAIVSFCVLFAVSGRKNSALYKASRMSVIYSLSGLAREIDSHFPFIVVNGARILYLVMT